MSAPIRVLLVEDNPGDAELTRETLADAKIHVDLSVVTDGPMALAYLRREGPFSDVRRPDLVLLDLNLPKMSGLEVLAELKRDAALKLIPVVVLTSSDASIDILRSYDHGASCYVTKPVGLAAFQEVVKAIESFWFSVVRLP